jgi:hypothetical protein
VPAEECRAKGCSIPPLVTGYAVALCAQSLCRATDEAAWTDCVTELVWKQPDLVMGLDLFATADAACRTARCGRLPQPGTYVAVWQLREPLERPMAHLPQQTQHNYILLHPPHVMRYSASGRLYKPAHPPALRQSWKW